MASNLKVIESLFKVQWQSCTFVQLVRFRAETDKDLANHRPRNAPKTIQNELLTVQNPHWHFGRSEICKVLLHHSRRGIQQWRAVPCHSIHPLHPRWVLQVERITEKFWVMPFWSGSGIIVSLQLICVASATMENMSGARSGARSGVKQLSRKRLHIG